MTRSRTLSSHFADKFASVFADLNKDIAFPAQTNDIVCSFNNICLSTLDVLLHLKTNPFVVILFT